MNYTLADFCQGHGATCTTCYDPDFGCDTDHGVRSYCDGTCQSARDEYEAYMERTALYHPGAFRSDMIMLDVRGHGRTPESYRVTFEGPDAQAWALAYITARPGYYFDEIHTAPLSRRHADLHARLYPVCDHGMSADLCEGPDHYMTRDQEIALGWG
jgi:hypothetical protein